MGRSDIAPFVMIISAMISKAAGPYFLMDRDFTVRLFLFLEVFSFLSF
jgi:hypothetical protein